MQRLVAFCPVMPSKPMEAFILTSRFNDGVYCLLYYLVKSNLEHVGHITEYLKKLLEMSFRAKWHLGVSAIISSNLGNI